jgi:hypothetical protein
MRQRKLIIYQFKKKFKPLPPSTGQNHIQTWPMALELVNITDQNTTKPHNLLPHATLAFGSHPSWARVYSAAA